MGKLQSKHAATARKRRESPEGDSFVASGYACGRKSSEEAERRARDKQELPNGDPKEGPFREDQCPLEVALPPEKAEGREHPGQLLSADDGERAANREGPRGPGGQRLNIDALQCDVSVEEDDRQEWTFTLYDFDNCGKVTREDMSSLMHTIYEVVDASVNHSLGSSKTLRVKLTVSPEPSSKRKEGPPAGQDREPTRCRMEGELAEEPRVADRRLSAHVRWVLVRMHPGPLLPAVGTLSSGVRRPVCAGVRPFSVLHAGGPALTPSPARSGGPTAWTRTRSAETTTWTSPGLRTTRPDSALGPLLCKPSRSPRAGPRTSRPGPAPRSQTHTPCTTAGRRCWWNTSCQPRSLLPGPWTRSPGRRGRRSSSSNPPRAPGSRLGCQPAASPGKPSATTCRPSCHTRPLRMATTSRSLPHSPHHHPMATSGTAKRAGRATRHSRPHTPSLPQWSTRWCGSCRQRQQERASRCQ
nr:protein naked cuticle homolog 2 isoform X2 [Pongo abelii]